MPDYTDQINMASTTEELHSPVTDNEEAIVVDIDTRDFVFGSSFNRIIGVVGDHNSEIVSFKIPRFIDGHDVSECAEHKLFWRNTTTKKEGEVIITDIKLSEEDEDTVLLGWLILEDVTESAGEIEFALRISDYNADKQSIYEWNTKVGRGLLIEQGFNS